MSETGDLHDRPLEPRNRVRYAAEALGERACVLAPVSVLAPDEGTRETWCLEATLSQPTVPPVVLHELKLADLALDPAATGTQADHTIVVAVPG